MNIHAAEKQSKYTTSIVGARGYSGLELSRLLVSHPRVKFTHAFATKTFSLSEELLDTRFENVKCLADSELLDNLTDVVFLATPAEVSYELAPRILMHGKRVIDLSGAFRLKKNDPQSWYGFGAASKEIQDATEYGLVPTCGAFKASTKLISNPGCYATAISLALIPLLKYGLIDASSIVIDAKSGTTGAGKKAAENLLFSEVAGDCRPYRVGKHQHTPEIQEAVMNASGVSIDPHFVTHLLSVPRGITAGIFAKTSVKSVDAIADAYNKEYGSYKLLKHGSAAGKLASLNAVVGTPFTHLSYELVGDKLYLFSCIDNLMKGAASQAVENLNRMLDVPVHMGLLTEE